MNRRRPDMLRDVTSDQIPQHRMALFSARVRSDLAYFGRARERLDRLTVVPDDPLYQSVQRVHDELHRLAVELHYRSVGPGVGR